MRCRAEPAITAALVLGLALWAVGARAAPTPPQAAGVPAQRAIFWRESIAAVNALVEGQHVQAVAHAARAHAAQPTAELDALVGLIALAGGKAQLSGQQLDSAIRRRSAEPRVFYWAGRAALASGRPAAAAQRFEQAVAIGSQWPSLQLAHALTARGARRGILALDALENAARRHPNLLDSALFPTPEQGAVMLLEGLLRGFPRPLALWRTQAHLYLQLEAIPAALERVELVLRHRKDDAAALQLGARCLAALGDLSQALSWARRAVAREPGLPTARATLGELLLAQGKARAASVELLLAASARPRDVPLLLATARACAQSEQPACADRFYGYALRRDPRLAEAHFGIALRAQQRGQADRARLAFRRAAELDPSEPRYYEGAAHFASLQARGVAGRSPPRAEARRLQGEARRLLAEALQARRQRAGLERTRRGAVLLFQRLGTALHRCGCGWVTTRCKTPATQTCEQSAGQLPGAAGRWLQAHLALHRARRDAARRALRGLLPMLRSRDLFLRDPRVFVRSGRTLGGLRYQVRKLFPMALIGPLPHVAAPKTLK